MCINVLGVRAIAIILVHAVILQLISYNMDIQGLPLINTIVGYGLHGESSSTVNSF